MVIPSLMLATGCEKKVEDPVACYKLSIKKEGEIIELTEPYSVDAGREIQFENCGKADFYSFFSGTPGNAWADFIDPSNTTTVGTDTRAGGDINYTYQTTGQYTATMVLTNRKVGDPYDYKQVTMNFEITVTESEE
jgi:hypothetical protein